MKSHFPCPRTRGVRVLLYALYILYAETFHRLCLHTRMAAQIYAFLTCQCPQTADLSANGR